MKNNLKICALKASFERIESHLMAIKELKSVRAVQEIEELIQMKNSRRASLFQQTNLGSLGFFIGYLVGFVCGLILSFAFVADWVIGVSDFEFRGWLGRASILSFSLSLVFGAFGFFFGKSINRFYIKDFSEDKKRSMSFELHLKIERIEFERVKEILENNSAASIELIDSPKELKEA